MYVHLEQYLRPASVAEALAALGPGAALLAGGTELNVQGHERLERVVDIQALGLEGLKAGSASLELGARMTLDGLLKSGLPRALGALLEAASGERNRALRNASTLGGRACRNQSDARILTALLALDARATRQRVGDAAPSQVGVAELMEESAGDAGDMRLVTALSIGLETERSCYLDFGLTAVDRPYVDVAVALARVGGRARVRIATGGHAADATGVVRLPGCESYLESLLDSGEGLAGGAELARRAREEAPAFSCARASGGYRQDLTGTLVTRAIERCLGIGEGS